jgi:ankyrin repeat protein
MKERVITAVLRENLDEVRAALQAGESADERDSSGRTALMHAAIDGLTEISRTLLAASADPRAVDRMGWSPLHFAVQGRHAEVVRDLLAAGADPSSQNAQGNSPTFTAVFAFDGSPRSAAVLRLVLGHGGGLDTRNAAGVSPRDLASRLGLDLTPYLKTR